MVEPNAVVPVPSVLVAPKAGAVVLLLFAKFPKDVACPKAGVVCPNAVPLPTAFDFPNADPSVLVCPNADPLPKLLVCPNADPNVLFCPKAEPLPRVLVEPKAGALAPNVLVEPNAGALAPNVLVDPNAGAVEPSVLVDPKAGAVLLPKALLLPNAFTLGLLVDPNAVVPNAGAPKAVGVDEEPKAVVVVPKGFAAVAPNPEPVKGAKGVSFAVPPKGPERADFSFS